MKSNLWIDHITRITFKHLLFLIHQCDVVCYQVNHFEFHYGQVMAMLQSVVFAIQNYEQQIQQKQPAQEPHQQPRQQQHVQPL